MNIRYPIYEGVYRILTIQRPLGESRRPQAQKRRRAAGKVAHGRGGLRAVENQPAHVAVIA